MALLGIAGLRMCCGGVMGSDFGTYHVRVEFTNGDGYISKWDTGGRFTHGSDSNHPLTAEFISPTWDSEAEILRTIEFMYTDGNYACDCNRKLFLARAKQQPEPVEDRCGDTLKIKSLRVLTPDGRDLDLGISET